VSLADFHDSLQTPEDRSYLIVENGYQVMEISRRRRAEFDALLSNAGLPTLETVTAPIDGVMRVANSGILELVQHFR
jgi:hypothetical protein